MAPASKMRTCTVCNIGILWLAAEYGGCSLKPMFHCDAIFFALGPRVGLDPQQENFVLRIPTCWYLKTLKFALPSTPNLKFALPPMPNPNASQWNIGCVGSQTQNFCIGHVHLNFLVSISFALASVFQWNMGLRILTFP